MAMYQSLSKVKLTSFIIGIQWTNNACGEEYDKIPYSEYLVQRDQMLTITLISLAMVVLCVEW
jgi:hypothetical protein